MQFREQNLIYPRNISVKRKSDSNYLNITFFSIVTGIFFIFLGNKYGLFPFSIFVHCDISNVILERNRRSYQFENLEFKQINLAEDELPKGDLAFVRQVLQHLSNSEIKKFVD